MRAYPHLRRLLLATLLLGILGTGAELLLLGHTEDVWQLVPLVLLALGLTVIGWHHWAPGRVNWLLLRGVMSAFLASGLLGVGLHFRGNAEFELEMSPGLTWWPLVQESLTGATPALAPGAMALLGLIGLAWAGTTPATH